MNLEEKRTEVPDRVVDAVLDSDAFAEIDDQFAIAYFMLASERIRPIGICAAPFPDCDEFGHESPEAGMKKSEDEIKKVLHLMGRDDFLNHVYSGAPIFLKDEKTPVRSSASEFLVKCAREHSPENPLYIIGIAAATNIASAILMDRKAMTENTVIIWLGGHATHLEKTDEYNMKNDLAAARILFLSDVPMVQVPCEGVTDRFYTTSPELRFWLHKKNPLATYLTENTENVANTYAAGKAWHRVIWDLVAVAWLLNDGERFMQTKIIPRHTPQYDFRYAVSEESSKAPMRYIYHIQRDELFTDFFCRVGQMKPQPEAGKTV